MATYNSVVYAAGIAAPSTGVGVTDGTLGLQFQDANINGGTVKQIMVKFNTAAQALNNGDIVNLAILPAYSRPIRITVTNDVATASATVQVGANIGGTATAGYFTTAAASLAAANTKTDAFTNVTNLAEELATGAIVYATIGGANLTTNTNLKFVIEYSTNS